MRKTRSEVKDGVSLGHGDPNDDRKGILGETEGKNQVKKNQPARCDGAEAAAFAA